jgi:iron complex transport system permease protein
MTAPRALTTDHQPRRPTARRQRSGRPRRPGHVTIRTPFFSARLNYRVVLFALLALVILLVLATWAMTLGSFKLPFDTVVRAVLGGGDAQQAFIVRTLRLPRVLSAILIGCALAISGAIFQGLVRNPLVSPDVIGIDSGATVFAVFWIATGRRYDLLPLAAFAGALVAAALVYLLAWKGGISANRLILVGIGVGAATAAGTTFLTIRFPIERVRSALFWTTGSVYGTTWPNVQVLALTLLVLIPAAMILTWALRALGLGDDMARGLGLPLERARLALIVVGCGLSAVTVAVAGPIGFVALMTPHIARILAGPLSGSVVLFTGMLGAIFLLGADTIAQHFLPVALPVGVVTSAIGAPYFLFLLYRSSVRM